MNWIGFINYKQASREPLWVEAIKKELQALTTNNTSDIVFLPQAKKKFACIWIYKVRLKALLHGTLERLKARLVAKDYTQEYVINYYETFSRVVKDDCHFTREKVTSLEKKMIVTLHCGNQSDLHIAHNHVLYDRTKHIKDYCHFTREKVMNGLINFTIIPHQTR